MTRSNLHMNRALQNLATTHSSRRGLLKGAAAATLGLSGAAALSGFSGVSAQDVTTLSFSHDKDPWQEFFVEMGDLAEAAISVNWEPTPYSDTSSYQAAILASLPTDQSPDFFTWWSGYRIENLYREGVLEDISDIWAAQVESGNLPESLGAAFTFDGAQYAIPSHVSYWVVFYNMRTFEESGIAVPTTWDEFVGNCETLKSAGVTPMASTQVGRWPSFILFEEMVLRTDPAFYEALTAGEASYTDETAVSAMETWRDLIEAEYFTSFDTDMTADWPPAFAQGEVAMIPIGTWYQSHFLGVDMVPGEDYGLFIMPNINPDITEKVAIVETGALAVSANTQVKDAAKEMATWWVQPEPQTEWANKLGDAPANAQAESTNPVLSDLLTTLADEDYRLLQRYWEASPVPIVEGAVDFLAQFMLNPGDLMSVLENIQELAETEWAAREG